MSKVHAKGAQHKERAEEEEKRARRQAGTKTWGQRWPVRRADSWGLSYVRCTFGSVGCFTVSCGARLLCVLITLTLYVPLWPSQVCPLYCLVCIVCIVLYCLCHALWGPGLASPRCILWVGGGVCLCPRRCAVDHTPTVGLGRGSRRGPRSMSILAWRVHPAGAQGSLSGGGGAGMKLKAKP